MHAHFLCTVHWVLQTVDIKMKKKVHVKFIREHIFDDDVLDH